MSCFISSGSLGFLFICGLVAHACLLGLVAETWGLSLLLQCMGDAVRVSAVVCGQVVPNWSHVLGDGKTEGASSPDTRQSW